MVKVKKPAPKSKPKPLKTTKSESNVTNKKKGSIALKLANPISRGITKTISKKEKQKKKKDKLRDRLEMTKAAFQEDKKQKKRKKTAIVGDLKPLLDSLPSLDELLILRDMITSDDGRLPNEPKTKTGRRNKLLHEKTEKMLDRFDSLQKIWRNPEFQKDPRKLIAEQIKARRYANEMET